MKLKIVPILPCEVSPNDVMPTFTPLESAIMAMNMTIKHRENEIAKNRSYIYVGKASFNKFSDEIVEQMLAHFRSVGWEIKDDVDEEYFHLRIKRK